MFELVFVTYWYSIQKLVVNIFKGIWGDKKVSNSKIQNKSVLLRLNIFKIILRETYQF